MQGTSAILALFLIGLPGVAQAQETNAGQDAAIVVRGLRDKPSSWRQAETDHVVVISDGSEKDLTRIAHNLERLHFLLSVLLNRVDQPDIAVKLRVTLVGDTAEFDAMHLKNLRSSSGPYVAAFPFQRYYDPREDGPVMAASRNDSRAILEQGTPLSAILPALVSSVQGGGGPDTVAAADMPGMSVYLAGAGATFAQNDPLAIDVNGSTVPIPAESRIYAGFAQNWLLTYFPNAYPRWYVDGFGELFSTIATQGDGSIEYGRAPAAYQKVMGRYLRMPLADILTGRYLAEKRTTERWTPYHAWALTHMLFFSNERKGQLHAYLATIAAGGSMEQAAAAFGDIGKLERELMAYDDHKLPYEQMTYPADRAGEPSLRQLTQGEAAFVKGRLELGARIDVPPASDDPRLAQARRNAIAERDRWIEGVRKNAARYPANLQAQLLLAEAECRSGNGTECVAAAERALAAAPGNSDALAWKGSGLVLLALAASGADRASMLKSARRTIAQANRADTENPLPLLAFYRSYADAGEAAPDVAIEGLMKAADAVPAAPGPRLLLGEALAKRGNLPAARKALIPVANGAYDSPEAARARALLATL
ncbi:hypothetical protein [Sphingomonas sp. KR3-1]|uniref:hypothetical protein n=1 Tax=Sphingomonas sp. KR3-1 TaxID=3156611 RepID=UPI0032B5A97F